MSEARRRECNLGKREIALEHKVQLTARDGYPLGATLYPRRAAVLCGGGGLPARLYQRFAGWLAGSGIPLLTFDYRGLGGSRPARLRGFEAGIEDWMEHDSAAAIAWLRARYPRAELAGIAHSIGGLILTCAPNAGLLSRFLFVAVHTGYCADYHPRWRAPMTLMWHVLMPAVTGLLGYFPGRALGMGADLPAGFASQWARRRAPPIELDNARVAACLSRCRDLRGSALALTFTDDGFATERGARRLLEEHLPQISAEQRVIAPRDAGLKRIGHFGFFRRSAEPGLWRPAAAWLAG
jgi:predicted alpha/beta hydrolase